MDVTVECIRSYRLRAHHLDRPLPPQGLLAAAGACGVQNSPPGAWETALFHRVSGCTLEALRQALYEEKSLLQAWSYRGVPVVFPTAQSGVFLTPLAALPGEEPWVYTRGISGALDFLHMTFDELLPLVREAARTLDGCTVKSKEALDSALAALVRPHLAREKQALWDAPSMYGSPDRQTVGGAAVSFLLRPCAFYSQVVFGRREGASPTFTSFKNWTGHAPEPLPQGGKDLVRKFLRCYGPATVGAFQDWLGCSPRQAKRLWDGVAEELAPVQAAGRACYCLAAEKEALRTAAPEEERLLLLGAHDPYLDQKDRAVLLADQALQRRVWRTVANPGAVLCGGRVIGIWTARTGAGSLALSLTVWEPLRPAQRRALQQGAEAYAAFRGLALKKYQLQEE